MIRCDRCGSEAWFRDPQHARSTGWGFFSGWWFCPEHHYQRSHP